MNEMDKELINEIKKLTLTINKTNGFWQTFLRGTIYGFGVVVGAALLVAIFVGILTEMEGWAYIGSYAHKIMEIIRQK